MTVRSEVCKWEVYFTILFYFFPLRALILLSLMQVYISKYRGGKKRLCSGSEVVQVAV